MATTSTNYGWSKPAAADLLSASQAPLADTIESIDSVVHALSLTPGSWSLKSKTANYTAAPGEMVLADATGGSFTVTVPTTSGAPCLVFRTDSTANVVTVDLGGGSTTNIYQAAHGRMTVGNGTTAYRVLDCKPFGYADYVDTNLRTGDYTLVKGDAGVVVEMNKATALTLTIPPAASVAWVVGTTLEVYQMGAGQVTVAPGAAVTLRAPNGATKGAHQFATIGLRYRGSDEWVLSGDLTT